MRLAHILGATLVSQSLVLAQLRSAQACGGCFSPPPPPTNPMTTLVTAHRMAFALSPTRTVLWDQIQYAGDPEEFSWVLPVRGDAKLETADDAWFEALEAVTSTRVSPPSSTASIRATPGTPAAPVGDSPRVPPTSRRLVVAESRFHPA